MKKELRSEEIKVYENIYNSLKVFIHLEYYSVRKNRVVFEILPFL